MQNLKKCCTGELYVIASFSGRTCILMSLTLILGIQNITPPPLLDKTLLSYIAYNVVLHVQAKAFADSQGGTILYKTFFLIAIYFKQKKSV